MWINFIKLSFIIVILLTFLICSTKTLNIVIESTVRGLKDIVLAANTQIENGSNQSFICKIFDNNIQKYEVPLLWFTMKNDTWNLKASSSNLQFLPVSFEDQGMYSCFSPKHNLQRYINFIVTNKNVRRIKRSDESDDFYSGHYDYDNEHRLDVPNFIIKFVYVMIGGFIIFFLVFVIVKCCNNNNSMVSIGNGRSFRRPMRNVGNANTFPPSFSWRSHRNDTPVTTDYFLPSSVIHMDTLDLPPTYADSTENSRSSSMQNLTDSADGFSTRILDVVNGTSVLPPTYEEALVNIVLSEPDGSTNTNDGGGDTGGGATGGGDSGGGDTGGGDSGGGDTCD